MISLSFSVLHVMQQSMKGQAFYVHGFCFDCAFVVLLFKDGYSCFAYQFCEYSFGKCLLGVAET